MYERFGYPGLFAAYKAGPARYAAHLRTGRTLPGETRSYLATLARTPSAPDMPPATVSGERLFFTVGTRIEHREKRAGGPCLFIDLHAVRDPEFRHGWCYPERVCLLSSSPCVGWLGPPHATTGSNHFSCYLASILPRQ